MALSDRLVSEPSIPGDSTAGEGLICSTCVNRRARSEARNAPWDVVAVEPLSVRQGANDRPPVVRNPQPLRSACAVEVPFDGAR